MADPGSGPGMSAGDAAAAGAQGGFGSDFGAPMGPEMDMSSANTTGAAASGGFLSGLMSALSGIFGGLFGDLSTEQSIALAAMPFPANIMGAYVSGFAQGDPNESKGGLTGPDAAAGIGGGYGDFIGSTITQKKLAVPPPPPKAKPPKQTSPNIRPTLRVQKKRTGRPETIMTSRLSDASVYKPTLLGQ